MKQFLLRLEGVDFDHTIEDTHHLSAFRGGSLALLEAPRATEKLLTEAASETGCRYDAQGRIVLGASIGVFRFEAQDQAAAEQLRDSVRDMLRKQDAPPFRHLSFVVDIAEGGDLAALRKAEARNRMRQFQDDCWALPAFDPHARGASPDFDRIRPATRKFRAPKGRVNRDDNSERTHDETLVSPSFEARFRYGRRARQDFYSQAGIDTGGRSFTDSLQDMIDDPPDGTPLSTVGKIAIFYADGNGFGAIRDKARALDDIAAFSADVTAKQQGLLRAIIEWLCAGADRDPQAYTLQEDGGQGLRFETLLWGGDETCFVMPAWLGIEFLSIFRAATRGWASPSGELLTHGIGIVICPHKAPIRLARRTAKLIADRAKEQRSGEAVDVAQIEIFESITLPETEAQLLAYREKLFGLPPGRAKSLDPVLTLKGDSIEIAIRNICDMKDAKGMELPRSQLFRLLRGVSARKGFDPAAADEEALTDSIRKYATRAGEAKGIEADALRVLGAGAPLGLSLAMAASLWDYIDPVLPLANAGEAHG